MNRTTQNDTILAALVKAPNDWVPMPQLALEAECFAVHSRIANLRERGYIILNKVTRVDGKAHSFYKLVSE